jgi:hypothetical protein
LLLIKDTLLLNSIMEITFELAKVFRQIWLNQRDIFGLVLIKDMLLLNSIMEFAFGMVERFR